MRDEMMRAAKIKKLRELKRLMQGKRLEGLEDIDSVASDLSEDENEVEDGLADALADMQNDKEGMVEGVEYGDEEGDMMEEMREFMTASGIGKPSGRKSQVRVMPPKPSITIAVSTKGPGRKKRR